MPECVCRGVVSAALQTATAHWDFLTPHTFTTCQYAPAQFFTSEQQVDPTISHGKRRAAWSKLFVILKMMELPCCLNQSHEEPCSKSHKFYLCVETATPCFWHHWHLNSLTPFFPPTLQMLVWPNSCPPFVERSPGSPERCCFKICKRKKSVNQPICPSLLYPHLWYVRPIIDLVLKIPTVPLNCFNQ